ncbi:MAG: TonB-dependent receptor, partial [Blastocatellia bacterium]|nr:TonB-dependent receptor [Blastocatellia bacterium]
MTDKEGAVISDAKITAKNVDTGLKRTVETDRSGEYIVSELPVGNYEITIERDGFQTATVQNLRVEVSSDREVNVILETGKVEQAVVVEGAIPLVSTTSNQLGQVFDKRQVGILPINGRDFTKLLVINTGATGEPSSVSDSPGSFGLFSVNGNRGRANNYLLDGTDMNDGYRNLPAINEPGVFGTPGTILPLEAVEELGLILNFPPEYGRNSGAIVNIVTKSGTNEFHGSAFEFFRNDKLDARNFFNAKPNPKTAFRNNQFGFSLGGPIIKNRTFFFSNYEGQRERVVLNSLVRVPTAAEFAALGGPTNPIIAGILARNPWPTPNISVPLFDPTPNLSASTPAINDIDTATIKIDHQFSQADQLTGRYYFGQSFQSFPLALLGGNILPGFNTDSPTRVQIGSISYLKVISPTKVNELRFGYNRFKQNFFAQDGDFNPNSIGLNTGVNNPRQFGLPFIAIQNDPLLGSSIASLGANSSIPRGRIATNLQLLDNFSLKLQKHEFKFGYEYRRTFVNGFFDAGYRGRLNFASLADFLAGRPSGGRSAMGDSQRGTFQNSHSAFFQDSYRVRPTVTLNYGVRYDY